MKDEIYSKLPKIGQLLHHSRLERETHVKHKTDVNGSALVSALLSPALKI